MSLHAADALEGFSELLDAIGVELTFEGQTLRAVLNEQEPKPQGYDLTPGDDEEVKISAFAEALTHRPRIGDGFEDSTGNRYRIRAWRQRPRQPVVHFTCIVTTP